MDNTFNVELHAARPHCGFGQHGPQSGVCKDDKCGQRAAALFAGYCAKCAPKHGISLLRLEPVCVPAQPAETAAA